MFCFSRSIAARNSDFVSATFACSFPLRSDSADFKSWGCIFKKLCALLSGRNREKHKQIVCATQIDILNSLRIRRLCFSLWSLTLAIFFAAPTIHWQDSTALSMEMKCSRKRINVWYISIVRNYTHHIKAKQKNELNKTKSLTPTRYCPRRINNKKKHTLKKILNVCWNWRLCVVVSYWGYVWDVGKIWFFRFHTQQRFFFCYLLRNDEWFSWCTLSNGNKTAQKSHEPKSFSNHILFGGHFMSCYTEQFFSSYFLFWS